MTPLGRKRGRAGIGLLACLFLIAVSAGIAAGQGNPPRRVTLLFTHDLHSHFLPDRVPVPGGGAEERGGYARLATLIDRERAKAPAGSLLVDAGDINMGTLFHTLFREEAAELRLMGEMGYDAATFGNHDYDFHPEGLASMLRAARAKGKRLPLLVASNVVFTQNDPRDAALQAAFREHPVTEYAVLERNGLRIGLFGIMGKDAADDTPFAAPVSFADPVERSKKMAEILRNREKADLVVCLSHTGTHPVHSRSEDEILAQEVPDIDVIISGHTHTVLPSPIVVGKTVIVSCGCFGAYLGVLELEVAGAGRSRAASYRLEPVASGMADHPRIAAAIAGFRKELEKRYLPPFGYRYDQVIAESSMNLPSPAFNQTLREETGLGNLIVDAFRFAVRQAEGKNYRHVHLAAQPDGTIRDTLLQGKIAVPDLFKVLSLGLGMDGQAGYPLVTFTVTGKELRSLLEVQTSVAPFKRDAYLQLSGIKLTFNPRRIPFDRVLSVFVEEEDGQYRPLSPDNTYRVCVNAYTARMFGYVSRVSHGLISVVPKNDAGQAIADWKEARVDADAVTDGAQDLKEWVALALYLQSLPDRDGNGIPDIPERYRGPEGRSTALPSWNPGDLLGGAGWITYGALGAFLLLLLLLFLAGLLAVRLIRRLFRRRRATDSGKA